jgi:signal peptidase II
MARRLSFTSQLYRGARISNNTTAAASGNPRRMVRPARRARRATMIVMPSTGRAAASDTKRRLAAIIAGVVVALDAVTKAIAAHALAGRGLVNLLGGHFHLELYRNFAGPGNILHGHAVLVSVLSLISVALITVAAWHVRTTSYAVATGLLLGGVIGNLLDRLLRAPGPLRGGVVDWIKPTLSGGSLNVADLSINAAVITLLIGLALDWHHQRRDKPDPEAAMT